MAVTKDTTTGKWLCQFYYKDWTGKRRHTTKRGFERKKDAEQYERDFLAKTQKQEPTVAMVAEAYKREILNLEKLGQLKPTTASMKRLILDSRILPYFHDVKIEKISPAQVNEWLTYLRTHSNKKERMASGTLNNYRSLFSQLFEFSAQNFGTETNPVLKTKRVKKYSNDKRSKLWTVEQYRIFYDSIKKPAYRVFFNTIFWAGLRIGEALALTPADIKPCTITIAKTFIRLNNGEYRITTPKNTSSVRTIEIPKYLYNQLSDYISSQYGLEANDRIFEPLNYSSVRSYLNGHAAKLGLPRISPHILRHSYASMLYSATGNILVVSKQLGHANSNTTLSVYAHAMPDAARNAVDTLERLSIADKQQS